MTSPYIWRRREATPSSARVNPNIQAPSWVAINLPTPVRCFSPWETPELKTVQAPLRGLGSDTKLCVEVGPAKASQYFQGSHTGSGSFPAKEVTFHVPRARFGSRGSDHQDPCLLPPQRSLTPLAPSTMIRSLLINWDWKIMSDF